MSSYYNISLFRKLQAPLLDALQKIEAGLEKLLANQIKPNELGLVEKAHEVTNNLLMVRRKAVAGISKTIEKGLASLNEPERVGWDYIRVQAATRALLPLVSAFSAHLKDMVAGNDELHVQLWPLWAKACEAMEMEAPEPEELFEIDPDFSGETFQPRPREHLAEVSEGAHERLVAAIGLVEAARSKPEMETALRKATEVFNQIYALRHLRSYQTYWLVVRARLAVGLMHPDRLLDEREEWLGLLREAALQLRKFGANSRRFSEEVLKDALKPLMKPWPAGWAVAHPTLAELDRRLGLSVFWQAVKDVQDQSSEGALAKFAGRQKEIETTLFQLHTQWNKLIGAPEEQRKAALVAFLRSLVVLGPKREWFPGTFVSPLFDAMKSLGDKLAERLNAKEQPPIDEQMGFEVAATILLLEEVTERRARWNQELETRCQHQAYRLGLAIAGRREELMGMPGLRWDARWKERQVEKAVHESMGLVHNQLATVEKALADLSKGEDEEEVRDRFEELKGRCRQVGLVLETLRFPLAAKVAVGIRDQIDALSKEKSVDPAAIQTLALALASLQRFVQSRKNGDSEAIAVLAPGLDALFGAGSYERELRALHHDQALSPPVAALERLSEMSVEAVVPAPQELPAEEALPLSESVVVTEPPVRNLRSELLGEGYRDEPTAPDILVIFLEEADAALKEVEGLRKQLRAGSTDEEAWLGLRRQFHTLKGSGRICGLAGLGEVAWWVEDRLNEALAVQEDYSSALDEALGLATQALAGWYQQLTQGTEVVVQASAIREALDKATPYFADGRETGDEEDLSAEGLNHDNVWPSAQAEVIEEGSALVETPGEEIQDLAQDETEDQHEELQRFVREDASKHAQQLGETVLDFELNGRWDWERLHWSAHTLAGLFRIEAEGRTLAKVVEHWAEGRLESPFEGREEGLLEAVVGLREQAEALAEGQSLPAVDPQWLVGPVLPTEGGDDEWELDLPDVEVQTLEAQGAGSEREHQASNVVEEVVSLPDQETVNTPEAFLGEEKQLASVTSEQEQGAGDEGSAEPLSPDHDEAETGDELGGLVENEDAQPPAQEDRPNVEEPGSSLEGLQQELSVVRTESQAGMEGLSEEQRFERDQAWEDIFSAVETIQDGFRRLTAGLLKLNEQDSRD